MPKQTTEVSLVAVVSLGNLLVVFLEEIEELHSHLHWRGTNTLFLELCKFLEALASMFVVMVAEHSYGTSWMEARRRSPQRPEATKVSMLEPLLMWRRVLDKPKEHLACGDIS